MNQRRFRLKWSPQKYLQTQALRSQARAPRGGAPALGSQSLVPPRGLVETKGFINNSFDFCLELGPACEGLWQGI